MTIGLMNAIITERSRDARVVELADSLDSGSSAHSGRAGSSPASRTMSNVHNDNEHSVNRSNRKIAPVFVYPALRVMYSTATPCRVSIVTLDGKEATSGISSTPIKL